MLQFSNKIVLIKFVWKRFQFHLRIFSSIRKSIFFKLIDRKGFNIGNLHQYAKFCEKVRVGFFRKNYLQINLKVEKNLKIILQLKEKIGKER